ncbi:hypothetical protein TNCV_3892011 [Trichonephila clavipes]|nr:hypothetical protein TNCV_3892011 [Trichonephila clavipes]
MTLDEEALVLVMEPIFNNSLDFIIVRKSPSLQSFMECLENVLFTRREVRALGLYYRQEIAFPSELYGVFRKCVIHTARSPSCKDVQESPSGIAITMFGTHSHMRTSIIMQDNPARQYALYAVLDILSELMHWGTINDSIDSRIIWRHPKYFFRKNGIHKDSPPLG